ncbi:MAG: BRCT domain-containing protein, partial [Candidatus Saccharimonadales bacterium]
KIQKATLDELLAVDGIGKVVAESLVAWFADPDNQTLIDKFQKLGVAPVYKSHANGPLHGKNFVITGTLEHMSRDQAAEKIRSLGGAFQPSLAKDTTYLVVGKNVGASKLQKAEKFGTTKIDETALLKMLR